MGAEQEVGVVKDVVGEMSVGKDSLGFGNQDKGLLVQPDWSPPYWAPVSRGPQHLSPFAEFPAPVYCLESSFQVDEQPRAMTLPPN